MKLLKNLKKELKLKNIIVGFLAVAGIILVFAFFDYLIHLLSVEYAVPSYYFKNKIIFGIIWGFIAYLAVKLFAGKINTIYKSLILSAAISIVLQVNYFLQGYPLDFVLEFLGIHFVILAVVSYLIFKIFRL